MFDAYHPAKQKRFQILDESGTIINPDYLPKMSDNEMVNAYKAMVFARVADQKAISYQRQGRMYTYPPSQGQEAIAVGSGLVVRENDWMVPSYRELGAYFAKGGTLNDILLYWGGREEGSTFPGAKNMLPIAVPIASQVLHAVGIGYALKYKGKADAVFCYFGDGGTSEGDFHEGLNFAGVWKAPVVFICSNNQYAISMPTEKQTAAQSIAIKSMGYGMPGIQVDGNDFFAMYAAATAAAEHARSGQGPVLIEAITYRLGAHTTADDPTKYRTKDEEQKWEKREPLHRLRTFLAAKGLWDPANDAPLREAFSKKIDEDFRKIENMPEYKVEDIFKYHYAEMPKDLQKQMQEHLKFLEWYETVKPATKTHG